MGELTLFLKAVDEGFTIILKNAKHEIDLFNVAAKGMQTTMNMLRVYSMSGALAIGAMVLPGIMASRALADYDLVVRRIMAAGGAEFAGHFDDVTAKIGEMSAEFGIAKEDIADGILELAKAGFQYSQIMEDLLEPITQLAIANGKDFALAAEVGTVAWMLYGDQVGDAARMMQIMHTTAIETLSDIDDYVSIFEYAGAMAVTTGIQFEEFMAQIGALSQLAFHSGMNLSTFFARMRASGDEMEGIFGVAPGSIFSDGKINLTEFNNILRETTVLTQKQTEDLSNLWGIRADKVFYAIKHAAGEYERVLGRIYDDNTSLVDGFEDMSVSLQYVWGQIIGVLSEPLIQAETLDDISNALQDFRDAISEGGLGEAIRDIIVTSIEYLAESGPQLIGVMQNMITTFMELTPTLIAISNGFISFLEFISKINPELIVLIGTIVLFNKVIPIATTLMWLMKHAMSANAGTMPILVQQYGALGAQTQILSASQMRGVMSGNLITGTFFRMGKQVSLTRLQFLGLNLAMMAGVMGGFMLLITGENKVVRALGAIMIAASALTIIMWQLAAANTAAQSGVASLVTLPLLATAAISTMAGIAAYVASTRGMAVGGYMLTEGWRYLHPGEYVIPEAKFGDALLNIFPEIKSGANTTSNTNTTTENYYDNRVVNVYDTSEDDIERVLYARGRI